MVTYVYGIFIIEFIIGIFLLQKYGSLSERGNRFKYLLFVLLFIIFIARVFRYDTALGLDMDEAMGGINSWSIGKYGVDYFNLVKHPVYLFAWGSGMNILYPLITVPLVKSFGLNLVIYRFPLIFVCLISIFVFVASILKTKLSNRLVILVITIIFLSPWSIESSRWAVESNLFPVLMIFVASFFILFYESQTPIRRISYLTLSTICIGLSGYAYSNNWIFLGCFVVLFYPWLLFIKKINWKTLLIQLILLVIIIFPLLLFIYVNYISHRSMYFLGMGIPKLAATRSAFVVANGHILKSIVYNIYRFIKLFVLGYDGTAKVSLPYFGALYPFMFIFGFIGIITAFKNNVYLNKYMMIMLISNIFNVLLIAPSWTHLNAMMLPFLYFEAVGVDKVFQTKMGLSIFGIVFSIMFIITMGLYFSKYQELFHNGEQNSPTELRQIIQRSKSAKDVYIVTDSRVNNMNSGAMFTIPIFYTKISPYVFHEETKNVKKEEFMSYNNYGKWHIVNNSLLTNKIKNKQDAMYIIQKKADKEKLPDNIKLIRSYEYYDLFKSND